MLLSLATAAATVWLPSIPHFYRNHRHERGGLRDFFFSFLGHVRRDPKPTGSESHGTAQIATSDG